MLPGGEPERSKVAAATCHTIIGITIVTPQWSSMPDQKPISDFRTFAARKQRSWMICRARLRMELQLLDTRVGRHGLCGATQASFIEIRTRGFTGHGMDS
jgi:hypothetical protein